MLENQEAFWKRAERFRAGSRPWVEMVTTCQGGIPAALEACLTASSIPPQGTSMRTTVTLWMCVVGQNFR